MKGKKHTPHTWYATQLDRRSISTASNEWQRVFQLSLGHSWRPLTSS